MNYRLDKKRNPKQIIWFGLMISILFILVYFRTPLFNGLANFMHFTLRPIFSLGEGLSSEDSGLLAFISSQKNLIREVSALKEEKERYEIQIQNYKSLENLNTELQAILGRVDPADDLLLANILLKPNRSLYDTIVIDVGSNSGVVSGNLVLALGVVPIGKVAEVNTNSAKVVLFSSPGERNEILIDGQNIFIEAIGRGGGNFEITLPREIELPKGVSVFLPGLNSKVLANVEATISDPRDAFNKILLVSPVNIQELRFVQIKRN